MLISNRDGRCCPILVRRYYLRRGLRSMLWVAYSLGVGDDAF